MVGNIKGSQNGFTFDTCVGIKVCENLNLGSLLACRVNFEDSKIHLSSQTIFEAKRLGQDIDHISKQIQSTIGAHVINGNITQDMQNDADYLLTVCPTLHTGDSQILAYTRATGTTLITCDRGLAEAARFAGVDVVNPDLLPCDKFENNIKTKINGFVKKVIVKPVSTKQKVKDKTYYHVPKEFLFLFIYKHYFSFCSFISFPNLIPRSNASLTVGSSPLPNPTPKTG